MIIIRNNIIPFKGFAAINLFGILFCRKEAKIDGVTINHESIHTAQMLEMLIIPYYIWYIVEYLIRLCIYGSSHKAYRNICFEKEAYNYENNSNYLENRKWYYWMIYL